MNVFEWLEAKENATLILALIGAVNGTLGLALSFLNRSDSVRQAKREDAHHAPWVALRIESGDHSGCLVRATLFNPSDVPFVIKQVKVETPHDQEIILLRPDPNDLLGPLIPDLKAANTTVPVNWTVRASPDTPEKPSFHEEFLVTTPRWSPETRHRWRPASKMRETLISIRFVGHTLSAAQHPIDLLVKASN